MSFCLHHMVIEQIDDGQFHWLSLQSEMVVFLWVLHGPCPEIFVALDQLLFDLFPYCEFGRAFINPN